MDFRKDSRSIRLRTRLIFYSTIILLLVMALVIILVEKRQSETIHEEARKRGITIAGHLAAVSTNALLTYNYIVLKQNAERVVLEKDVLYVIIHDKEDKVAAYSQHDEKQGMILTDEVSQKATRARAPLIQPILYGEKEVRVLDISIPVYIKESQEKWGTIRIGLSLEGMSSQILKTRLNLLFLGGFAIALGILGSIFFARRITQPISNLVGTTIAAAKGDLDQVIDIHTGDEIEELGKNFNHMIQQIRLHQTELENRLREITSLKAYTDNVLSSMTNGLITIDLEEKIVTLNEMAERILGKRSGKIVGLPLERVLSEDHPLYRMMIETLSREEGVFRSEMELKKDEGSLWLTVGTSLLTDGKGKKLGALVLFQDITGIKALEEKLRQADRLAALGTLSAGLAHEVKNPLSAIKTFVQLLPRKLENPSFMEKFNSTVPREIDRINQLVEDLLELTRRRVHPFVALDVNYLILQVIDLHGEEMEKKQIRFEDHLDRTIPPVEGNSETLYRAFSNLAINAIQAMPEGGSLIISSKHDSPSSGLQIIFRDTGVGMDEETSKNLFNPFFTTKDRGVGLGMALTHKIIEDHRGTIEVMSEKGAGTTFVLMLPVIKS
ncbi:MAG: HAMP domain-containing protein [Deltaproteobacteria bacterium]|nr:HAMP domain-containing protein [Deltaproteobacteria bacterium]